MKKSMKLLIPMAFGVLLLWPGIFFCNSLKAQQNNGIDSLQLKARIYKATIRFNKKKFTAGYLANLSDSALQLSSFPVFFHLDTRNQFSSAYKYNQLERVSIRRKGAIGRGALYGALTGLSVGVITGLVSGNDSPDIFYLSSGAKAILLGTIGIPGGALIGLILGAVVHKTFIIDGNKNEYENMRESIFNNLFRHRSKIDDGEEYIPNL